MNSNEQRSRLARWLLLTGDRRLVIAVVLIVLYLSFVPAGLLLPESVNRLLSERGTVAGLLNTLLSGVILSVTIVVSVSSLYASRGVMSMSTYQDHIEGTRQFRNQTRTILNTDVSPARPAAFLQSLTDAIHRDATTLQQAIEEDKAEVSVPLNTLIEEVEHIDKTLEETNYSTFPMLLATLEFGYAEQQHALRKLQSRYSGDLPEDAEQSLDELLDALEYFSTAREYFKSLYFEREFANLSRDLLYTSLPAIVIISYAILAVDSQIIIGTFLGVTNVFIFAMAAYTVALAPFVVLGAYVGRVSAVTKRPLDAGPFIIHEE